MIKLLEPLHDKSKGSFFYSHLSTSAHNIYLQKIQEVSLMKKLLIFFLLMFAVVISHSQLLFAEAELQNVRLLEVVHSIFYTPQYVALNKGFFNEEGLNVELSTAWGGDKAAASLMAGGCDIALIGPEPTIYVYKQGAKNYMVNFAQLTNTAGSFLVAREPMPDFDWEDVRGKVIIGNRPGGAPQMVLEYCLKEHGIYPGKDVEVITNLDFTANAGAFVGGLGDFVQLFEPNASTLEVEGQGHVVGSFGKAGGSVPYTVFMAKIKYIEENPDIIQSFTNAIYRAQQWVDTHSLEEIMAEIRPFFADSKDEVLLKVIDRYKKQGSWDITPIIEEDIFNHYQDIIIMAGELDERAPYEVLVNTEFARNAIGTVPE